MAKVLKGKSPAGGRPSADLIAGMLAGLESPRAGIRFGASKALRNLSGESPELVYPHFERIARQLAQSNQILLWNALLTLANLAVVDREGRIEAILEPYLRLIRGPGLITAANAIRGAAVIGVAKPELAPRIVRSMLGVARVKFPTPECHNVAVGHALTALGELAKVLPHDGAVRRFAERQLDNPRPATRRKAERLARLAVRG